MKIGEIKIEALKLMFASYDWDYNTNQLGLLKESEQFKDYLINMPGSINRCFAVLENKGALPLGFHKVNGSTDTADGVSVDMDTEKFLDVERVSYQGKYGDRHPSFPYIRDGNVIYLEGIFQGDSYTIYYRPRISRAWTDDTELSALGVPDRIAALIPYFIKGDLFREEDAAEASNARAWFEGAMDELNKNTLNYGGVQTVYGM